MHLPALPVRAILAILLAGVPLTACKKSVTNDTGNASGQILPGSISDAMLPEDRVTSAPPLDPGAMRTGRPGAPAEESSQSPEAPGTAAAAEPTPAATAPAE